MPPMCLDSGISHSGAPNLRLSFSPLTLFALSSIFPEARSTLAKYAVDQMVPAYHVGSGWTASDRVTIDYGSAYILIVRQRRGMFENLLDAIAGQPPADDPAVKTE